MIETRPGAEFYAIAEGFPSGLTPTFGVRQLPQGTLVIAQTDDDIEEFPQAGGVSNYQATRTFPEDADPTGPGVAYVTAWGVITVDEQEEILVGVGDTVPNLTEVGALLRTRTKTTAEDPDSPQTEIGTFNAYTRPTGEQVQSLISQAVTAVSGRLGDREIDEPYWPSVRHVTALYAATLVESSYFPEQIESGQSPYDRFRELWREEVEQLTAALSGGSQSKGMVTATFITPYSADSDEESIQDVPLP